jgi:hypothetical protein
MERPKVKTFVGPLAKNLYAASYSNLYDEICYSGFAWYGLVMHNNTAYVLEINYEGIFKYKEYPSQRAAKKAWDHICIKFERWYEETYE